jgi:predicted nucleic acid-binding protein
MSHLSAKVVLTEFILLELGNMFKLGEDRPKLTRLVADLRSDAGALVIPASRRVFQDALDLFGSRPDKEWSLTDCTSFVIMDEYGIAEALTSRHHFEQAGFTILLK